MVQSVSLNSYIDLFNPRMVFPLSFSFSFQLQTPPNFSLYLAFPPPVCPHPRRESRTHDAMANGERTTHAPMIFFSSFMASPPYSASCKARDGLVVESTGRRSKGVATGNANELHERRQIEQHTTMVSSCHPSPTPVCLRWLLRRYDKPHRKLVMHKYGRLCDCRRLYDQK